MDVLIFRATVLASIVSLGLAAAPPVEAQDTIGVAVAVISDVKAEQGKDVRQINLQSGVNRNDLVVTGDGSSTQLMFMDETVISIGPNADLLLDDMVYTPGAEGGTFAITVKQGLIRMASGIQSSNAYEIHTPVATIGIRGTEFDVLVEEGGETSVLLHSGSVLVTNGVGGQTLLTEPGTFTSVTGRADPPSEANAAPQALKNMGETLVKPEKGETLQAEWKEAKKAWIEAKKAAKTELRVQKAEARDDQKALREAAKLAKKAGGKTPKLKASAVSEVSAVVGNGGGNGNGNGNGNGGGNGHKNCGKGKGKGNAC
ncbi:MAG: FecR domain-containing protein [Rhodobacterales bacterium]|nr:FecR domain-containing protein [Rhodobacterales bacterium]